MDQNSSRRTVLVCLLLGLCTIALYSPAFRFDFVNYDDPLYVVNNPHVNRGLTAENFAWAFQAGYAANWHPATWISHMLDAALFGPHAGGHHATNILLHALNSALLLLLLARMTGAFWRSAAVAALFACHPLHVESVAWISERKDVLSGFFWMLSLLAWLRYVRSAKTETSVAFYFLALLLFAFGLMSKPMVVTLPCVLLLMDWWPLGRLKLAPESAASPAPQPIGKQILSLVAEKIPFFALSVGSSVISVIAQHREGSVTAVEHMPFQFRLITALFACFRYISKTFWPTDLGALYSFITRAPKLQVLGVALVLVVITVLAIQRWKSRPYWLFGWLWYLGMLFPTLNLVTGGGQPMADRYFYLPSIGLFVMICWEVYDLAMASQDSPKALAGFCGVALVGFCVVTSFQLRYWRNGETLVARIAMPESNAVGHADYAAYLMHHNKLAAAEVEARKATAIFPDYGALEALLGGVLEREGKSDEAIDKLSLSLSLDHTLIDARLPLGRALLRVSKPDDAARQFKMLLQAEPGNFEADSGLAAALMAEGRPADGIGEYRHSLKMQPNQPDTLNDLAWILATTPRDDLRNGAEAVTLATRACELTGNTQPMFIGTLAAAFAEVGRWEDAVATAQKAHDVAMARGMKPLAEKNLQLQQLYRSHKTARPAQ